MEFNHPDTQPGINQFTPSEAHPPAVPEAKPSDPSSEEVNTPSKTESGLEASTPTEMDTARKSTTTKQPDVIPKSPATPTPRSSGSPQHKKEYCPPLILGCCCLTHNRLAMRKNTRRPEGREELKFRR